MKRPIAVLAVSALVLSGCAGIRESRLNPFNWFAKSQEETLSKSVEGENIVIDRRGLIDQVLTMRVERVSGGALVHAMGLSPTQGFWDGDLVAQNGGVPVNGVLSYDFRIQQPPGFERVSTQQSREVLVGLFVSDQDLAGVSQIRVVAARNARVARR